MDARLVLWFNSIVGRSGAVDALIISFERIVPVILFLLLLGFIVWPGHPRREKIFLAFVPLVSGLIARYIVTNAIRFFYDRPRPYEAYAIHNLFVKDNGSFPSGHAAFFFALGTALYFYDKRWGIGFLCAAALISFSRVAAGVHYPTDILGGAAIGVAVALGVRYAVRRLEFVIRLPVEENK